MARTEAHRRGGGPRPGPDDAALAVVLMAEMSPDLRGCAILGEDGAELASSGGARWAEAGAAFLQAADAAGGEPATQAHVGTEDGEAFAVREGGLAMLAVTERFTLASLVLFDMRTILRDLAAGAGLRDRRAAGAPPPEEEA